MKPSYHGRPIGSVAALAKALKIDPNVLIRMSKDADNLYSTFTIDKRTGGLRTIREPSFELKIIQKRINRQLFDSVKFPPYLFGGIAERDYLQNASLHAGARGLVTVDVADFYPHIDRSSALKVFKIFFNFPTEVAEILASLTTLDGSVPQGAPTSSHLANLVFFDKESRLVHEFHQRQWKYSRLLDDITISKHDAPFSKEDLELLFRLIKAMLKMHKMKLRTKKTEISDSKNPESPMRVTGLHVKRKRPTASREERREIRLEVGQCERLAKISTTAPDYHKQHNRTLGRVGKLTYIGHVESEPLRNRLSKILPTYSPDAIDLTVRTVRALEKSRPNRRESLSYITRYNKAVYRVGILGRSHRKLASELREKLKNCRPTASLEGLIHGA